MSRTTREQEAYLAQQYFNGNYSDADYDCTCSGNNPPVRTPTPVITTENADTGENVSQNGQPQGQAQNQTVSPTIDEQIEDLLNQNEVLPPLMPEPDFSFPGNEFIEEPTLPSGIGDLASQSGAAAGTDNINDVVDTDTNKAGVWMLGLVLGGIALRQLFKKKKPSAKKVTL